ncbi:MAG: hypothetical protein SF053_12640 [Bacteroidia bacterium]|nr:hypothetical protein [Bacteroidia bacterium]
MALWVWVSLISASAAPFPAWLPEGQFEQVKKQAATTYRPFLVYFFHEADRDSRRMNRQTLEDANLALYIREHYLAIRTDVLAENAQVEIIQQYSVYNFPAVLIFSPEGKLMGRTEGYVSSETLQGILAKHHGRIDPTHLLPQIALVQPEEVVAMAEPRGTARGGANGDTPIKVTDLQTPAGMTARDGSLTPLHLTVSGFEDYSLTRLERTEDNAAVFGLLYGSYTQADKLTTHLDRLKKFWRGHIWIFCEEISGTLVYRLALGQYEDRETAEVFAESIQKLEKVSCQVLVLSQLR